MGRKANVRWYESKNGYYCTLDGKRHRLGDGPDDSPTGPNHNLAVAEFIKLTHRQGGGFIGPDNTIRECCERYRRWLDETKKIRTAFQYDGTLAKGLTALGDLRLSELKLHHVEDWLHGQTTWGSTMKHHGWRALKSALKFNVVRGHTLTNPLAAIKTPAEFHSRARGAECALSDGVLNVLLGTAEKNFSDFLTVLLLTGARPGELVAAEERHYDRSKRAIIFRANDRVYKWKNAAKTGKDRVIILTAEAVGIVERRISRQGAGPVFKNQRGKSLAGRTGAGCWMGRLKHRDAVAAFFLREGIHADAMKGITMYSFRHTYATKALKCSVPVKTLADLMGTSVYMIERHYGHLTADENYMRRMAELVTFDLGGKVKA